jgi:hypothetical protein
MQDPLVFLFFMALVVVFYAALAAALLRSAGKAVAGFRPRFRKAFWACGAGFLASSLIELLLGKFMRHESGGQFVLLMCVVIVCAIPVFTVFLTLLARNRGDQAPTLLQAFLLSLLQAVVNVAGSGAAWWALQLIAAQPAKPI